MVSGIERQKMKNNSLCSDKAIECGWKLSMERYELKIALVYYSNEFSSKWWVGLELTNRRYF